MFVTHVFAMSSHGFPLTTLDLRCVVKAYAERTRRRILLFQNGNFPSEDLYLLRNATKQFSHNERTKISATAGLIPTKK